MAPCQEPACGRCTVREAGIDRGGGVRAGLSREGEKRVVYQETV